MRPPSFGTMIWDCDASAALGALPGTTWDQTLGLARRAMSVGVCDVACQLLEIRNAGRQEVPVWSKDDISVTSLPFQLHK